MKRGRLHQDGLRSSGGMELFDFAASARCNVSAPRPQNPCTPPADIPPELHPLRVALSRCLSRATAKTAPQLAAAAGLWEDLRPADRGTRTRDLITTYYEALALPGRVLIATSAGYWYTDDPEEITHYDHSLLSRIREIALRTRRVRFAAKVAGFVHHGRGRWTHSTSSSSS